MRRFMPRRGRREGPPYDNTHQHQVPGPWPIVVLAVMMLVIIGLIAVMFGQQARLAETQREVILFMEGKGEFRDREEARNRERSERTRELFCAVMPQLEADDAGVLERYARDLGCAVGPLVTPKVDESAALPTPIDGTQPNSTGEPDTGTETDKGSSSDGDAGGTGTQAAGPTTPAGDPSAPAKPSRPAGASPSTSPPSNTPPSTTPPESEGSGGVVLEVDPGLKLCLPLLGCVG